MTREVPVTAPGTGALSKRAGWPRLGALASVTALLIGLVSVSFAQSVPKLTSVSVEWIQRGSTIDATISGENLAAVNAFVVSGESGVTVTNVPAGEPLVQIESSRGGISSIETRDEKSLKVRITVDAQSALGSRDLRAVSSEGISNPLTLNVTHLPEILEADGAKPIEQPQTIPLPVAVTGRIAAAAEVDHYRFKAKQGEHVVVEVYAARIGAPMDSSLAVFDAAGKELARNGDSAGLDSMLDFAAPADGEYVVQVRDFKYQGGGDYRYRLLAGTMPFARNVFPFGGQRGNNIEIEMKGPNLGRASKVVLGIAESAPLGRQEIRAQTPAGLSNPFPFDVSDAPNVMESEPNSAIDQADVVPVPVAINGRVGSEKDYDAFKFTAKKDQTLNFEVVAHRFGSKLDALLTLTDAVGNVLKRNDDTAAIDARIEQKFTADGEYVVIVEDLLERGGDELGYRLKIGSGTPDFSVRFLPDVARIHRGGHVPIRCELTRQGGFGEPVRITLDVAPMGVHAEPLLISPGNPDSGVLLVSAAPNASTGSFPIRLVATSTIGGKAVTRNVEPLSGDRVVKDGFVTVLNEAPFTIELVTLAANAEQNQTANVEVAVQRRAGFDGEIKLMPDGFAAGRDPITRNFEVQPLTLKAGESRGTLALKPKLDSEVGVRPIYIKADAKVGEQNVTQFSRTIPATVSQVPFVISTTLKRLAVAALPAGSESAAREAIFTVKADRRAGFNGEIALTLEGVPEGITATIDKIPAGMGETNVKLVASDNAPAGKEFTLTVKGAGVHNDRNYRFQPEQIKLTVNAPEPVEQAPVVAEAKTDAEKKSDEK